MRIGITHAATKESQGVMQEAFPIWFLDAFQLIQKSCELRGVKLFNYGQFIHGCLDFPMMGQSMVTCIDSFDPTIVLAQVCKGKGNDPSRICL